MQSNQSTEAIRRLPGEKLLAWHDRVKAIIYEYEYDCEVSELGFPFMKLRMDGHDARHFSNQLSDISKALSTYGIEICYMTSNDPGITFGKFLWFLFEDDASAIQAKLMIEINPNNIIS